MELYTPSSLSLTLLGSTLKGFEDSHTEYSSNNTLTNGIGTKATLYEDIGFKPFKVTIYDLEGCVFNFMTRLSPYKGTYSLVPLTNEVIDNKGITKPISVIGITTPIRVVIHLSTKPEEWVKVRVVIQDSNKDIPIIYDISSPTSLSIKEEIIDSYSGFYNPF